MRSRVRGSAATTATGGLLVLLLTGVLGVLGGCGGSDDPAATTAVSTPGSPATTSTVPSASSGPQTPTAPTSSSIDPHDVIQAPGGYAYCAPKRPGWHLAYTVLEVRVPVMVTAVRFVGGTTLAPQRSWVGSRHASGDFQSGTGPGRTLSKAALRRLGVESLRPAVGSQLEVGQTLLAMATRVRPEDSHRAVAVDVGTADGADVTVRIDDRMKPYGRCG